ncbi:hypothetical protein ABT160_40205 [Streptomyces sp. NPDC001941]|uniref:hypothetical protein n=1 Tax=Streptomyces sp. NPDC001941 TaxID=3154659 RepID=UPI00332A7040
MDEMTTLSTMRDDAPRPDRARLTPGRQRLLDAAAAGPGGGRRVLTWKVLAPGAAAAVAAVAVLGTQAGSDTPREPRLESAAAVLDRMADQIEEAGRGQAAPTLRPDQWALRETVDIAPAGVPQGPALPAACAAHVPGLDSSTYVQMRHDEVWHKGDGTRNAAKVHLGGTCDTLHVVDLPSGSKPLTAYYAFAAKPHKPQSLLADLQRAGLAGQTSKPADEYRELLQPLLIGLKASPSFTATVYRALARVEGVRVADERDPVLGKEVRVVSFATPKRAVVADEDLLLDPVTYRLLGTRAIARKSVGAEGGALGSGTTTKDGDPVYLRVFQEGAMYYVLKGDVQIVDRPGQRR